MTFERDMYLRQQADLLRFGVRTVADVEVEPITLEAARQHLRVDVYDIDDPESEASPPDQLTISDDDAWIEAMLPAAREYCEQYLGRALAPRTLEYVGNAFPTVALGDPPGPAFELPMGPVQSIASITYDDQAVADAAYTEAYDTEFLISGDVELATAAGEAAAAAALSVTVPADDYAVDAISVPSRALLTYGSTWPVARSSTGSVRVRYVTGYSVPGESPQVHVLPKMARAAILLMLGHLYENREAVAIGNLVEIPLGVHALLDLLPRERLGVA